MAVLLWGCGDLTQSGFGEVEVYAIADASIPSQAPEGLLAVEMRVYLQPDGTTQWTEITNGVRDLTLDLRGSERRVAVQFLSAGRYTRLRLVMQRVEASVSGGLVVGGAPVTGQVSVELGPQGSLAIERELLLELRGDGAADLVLDLNADEWLPTVSPATRTVSGVTLADVLAVRTR
jgi:hypothetical protein